jgi:hypothetical protein
MHTKNQEYEYKRFVSVFFFFFCNKHCINQTEASKVLQDKARVEGGSFPLQMGT